jgi:hypothetical protein
MRFEARHIGSGRWGVYDGGVMGWRAVDLGEDEACQMAMDMDVVYNQYGQRTPEERREVRPPIEVELATWAAAGTLDFWVRERGEWWGRVRGPEGRQMWIKARDLRRTDQEAAPQAKADDGRGSIAPGGGR